MALISSVGRVLTAANRKADILTAGSKVVLCLPSILSDFGASVAKQVIGGLLSKIGNVLTIAAGGLSSVITNTVRGYVSQITGSIIGTINVVTQTIGQIGSTIDQVIAFYEGLEERVEKVKDFTEKKENCDFAAATLLNCIISQTLSELTPSKAINIAKGLQPINNAVNELTDSISKPGGAINRTVNKAATQVDRAANVINKASIF